MNRGDGRWTTAGAIALATMVLVGCASTQQGTAVSQPYQAMPSAQITAKVADLPEHTIGVAPDLSAAVQVDEDNRTCMVPLRGDGERVCAEIPDGPPPLLAVFSPGGTRYALFPDVQRYLGEGGAWIVESGSGTVRQIRPASGANPTPDGTTPDGTTPDGTTPDGTTPSGGPSSSEGPPGSGESGSTEESRPGPPDQDEVVFGGRWRNDDELIAIGFDNIQRVEADTGAAHPIAVDWPVEHPLASVYAMGGGTMAVQLSDQVVAIDIDSGTVLETIRARDDQGGRMRLLGVSPDGRRLLLSWTNPQTFRPGPAEIAAIDGGRTKVDLPQETFVYAGGFSPDGSQVVLLTAGPSDSGSGDDDNDNDDYRSALQVAAADGTGTHQIAELDEDILADGPLAWSRWDVVSTATNWSRNFSAWQLAAEG